MREKSSCNLPKNLIAKKQAWNLNSGPSWKKGSSHSTLVLRLKYWYRDMGVVALCNCWLLSAYRSLLRFFNSLSLVLLKRQPLPGPVPTCTVTELPRNLSCGSEHMRVTAAEVLAPELRPLFALLFLSAGLLTSCTVLTLWLPTTCQSSQWCGTTRDL